jgi:hypothetical protein
MRTRSVAVLGPQQAALSALRVLSCPEQRMIRLATAEEIDRLLRGQKLSQRKIAVLVRVSRGTVSNVKHYPAKYGLRSDCPHEDEEPVEASAGPKVRCAGCGGMVCLPCIACRDRAVLASARRSPGDEDANPDALNHDFHGEAQARYEELRKTRQLQDLNQATGVWQEPEIVEEDVDDPKLAA